MTQFYYNKEPIPIEAKYIFPLDSNSAVCDFQADIDGQLVQAVAMEKTQAATQYDAAIKRGDGAYLLEAEREDVFQVSLGNVPPWTRVNLTITYVVELDADSTTTNATTTTSSSNDAVIRFVLPTAVAPRYITLPKPAPHKKPWYTYWSHNLSSAVSTSDNSNKTHHGKNDSNDSSSSDDVNDDVRRRRSSSSRRGSSSTRENAKDNSNKSRKKQKRGHEHNDDEGNDIMQNVNRLQRRKVPYALSLYVRLEMPSTIEEITSKTHPIYTVFDGDGELEDGDRRKAGVMFARENEPLNGDFVLKIKTRDGHQPRALIEDASERQATKSVSSPSSSTNGGDAKEQAMMVTLVPHFVLDSLLKAEVVFVVDRSGSMQGSKISQTKLALSFFLNALTTTASNNDQSSFYFNIVGFGTNYEVLFSDRSRSSRDANSIEVAQRHVLESIEADLGGTILLEPLKAVYALPEIPGHPRQIIVLTDGEVADTEEVIALVRENHQQRHSDWRLFAMGIGSSVSHSLVRGMAKVGRGTVQMVGDDKELEPFVEAAWRQALQPSLTNVQVDWGIPFDDASGSRQHLGDKGGSKAKRTMTPSKQKQQTQPYIIHQVLSVV